MGHYKIFNGEFPLYSHFEKCPTARYVGGVSGRLCECTYPHKCEGVKAAKVACGEVSSVTVRGFLWTPKNGPTVHKVCITGYDSDFRCILSIESRVTNGYENEYETTAANLLDALGVLTNADGRLHAACNLAGIALTSERSNVARKKDL